MVHIGSLLLIAGLVMAVGGVWLFQSDGALTSEGVIPMIRHASGFTFAIAALIDDPTHP